jgi:hypothetical protein
MRAGMHWPRVDDLEYNCIYAFDINSSFNFNLIPDPNPMKLSKQVSQFEKLFVMWILACILAYFVSKALYTRNNIKKQMLIVKPRWNLCVNV